MRIVIAIFVIGLTSNLFSQPDNTNVQTLTFYHGIQLPKIQEPGSSFIFKQLCSTLIDSVISSGNMKMVGSKIGKIKDCMYEMQIRNDTVRTVIIETSKKINTKQALSQATIQFGNPKVIIDTESLTYEWNCQSINSKFNVKLVTDDEQVSGTMTLTK